MNDLFPDGVTSTNAQPFEPLTLESLTITLGQLFDTEARNRAERDASVNSGFILIRKALEQGVITNDEYTGLSNNLILSGGLIASPELLERLRKVKV